MSVPRVIEQRVERLGGAYPCKIGLNDPVRVSEGTLYVPFFDTADGSAPDAPLPLLLMSQTGAVREVYGPSAEWLSLVSQIPA